MPEPIDIPVPEPTRQRLRELASQSANIQQVQRIIGLTVLEASGISIGQYEFSEDFTSMRLKQEVTNA